MLLKPGKLMYLKCALDKNIPILSSKITAFALQPRRDFVSKRRQETINNDLSKSKRDFLDAFKRLSEKNQFKILTTGSKDVSSDYGLANPKKKIHRLLLALVITGIGIYGISRMFIKSVSFKILDQSYGTLAEDVSVRFSDVKGCDEVKDELCNIVQFLKHPNQFKQIGAKLPKGILLVGDPGVGKTLLAKAVAGEAGVPFIYTSGSSFDEVFVGVGAMRVRKMFEMAKERAPCILFIDEIDSVGGKRSSSSIHPYANQTINMLLSELDGFSSTDGVIVLGATNQKDQLDKALLRPGRFDREIYVARPVLEGRKELFSLYLDKVKYHPSVDIDRLASATVGFSGADIQNMVNQAALRAGLVNAREVCMEHLMEAQDLIGMGPARRRPTNTKYNETTAYHEAGHAIVAMFTPGARPLYKVTIIPRGTAGGFTAFLPEHEMLQLSKKELLATLAVCMGGRIGEEVAFGKEEVTTGVENDIQHATSLARKMVTVWGFSNKVGLISLSKSDQRDNLMSDQTRSNIDAEVTRLLNEAEELARTVVKKKEVQYRLLAKALLHFETLTKEQIEDVFAGRLKVPEPKKRPTSLPSEKAHSAQKNTNPIKPTLLPETSF